LTKSQYYTKRAAECLLASAQIPSDRDVLLHMASVYIQIAIEIETREARREVWPLRGSMCDRLLGAPSGTS
jgi:hypothetical protein